ncbi:MAG: TetR/AcrR family transcriptional regulator [Rhizobiaceae bacterium]
MASQRFSRSTWIDLGLSELREVGPPALTIDHLCGKADKTRGSFYFHFESIENYLTALAWEWHDQFTSQVISASQTNTSRLDLLNTLAVRLDLNLEAGIRQLALVNDAVSEVVTDVDRERVSWLAKLYQNSGKYNADQATALARIEYAAFTGFKLVEPDMTPAEAREIYSAFLEFTDRA